MRLPLGAAASALSTLAIGLGAAPALALAGAPGGAQAPSGGAQAPSAPTTGGVEYGFPASVVQRLLVTSLSVPSSSVAGRPPRVTLRLDEHGVATVYVVVSIIDLSSRRTAVVTDMGWSHTGRTIVVRWPGGARLGAGTYRVSVSARDHHGDSLVRRAHSSGRATLTVRAAPKPPPPPTPAPAPVPTPAPEAGVPTPAQTVADGARFPVAGAHSFGDSENRFGAPRGGHIHEGQDVLTAEGTPVEAPLAGTIESTSFQAGGAGYYIVEHTSIGFDLFFAHCRASTFAVAAGEVVTAGQGLCQAGQTGDATAPHLHFEMWVGGWQSATGHPIDPLPYLEAWPGA
ncbi:MAG TPA: M23 family metallopeptidase [Solirubrobacteraceae bacterium]